jgi:Trypsin-co-occurring domain 1
MAEFVRFALDDGSEVLFESAESDLAALHGGPPEVRDGGKLTARLQEVAEAAEEVAGSLRARLVPDEVSLEFGLKVSGGVNWFFAKAQGEGTIKVTVKWAGNSASATTPGTGQDPGRGDVRGPGRGGAGDRSGVHRRAPRRVGNSGRSPVPAHCRACAAAPRLRYGRQGTGGAGRAGVPGPGAGRAAWQGDRVASRLGPGQCRGGRGRAGPG